MWLTVAAEVEHVLVRLNGAATLVSNRIQHCAMAGCEVTLVCNSYSFKKEGVPSVRYAVPHACVFPLALLCLLCASTVRC